MSCRSIPFFVVTAVLAGCSATPESIKIQGDIAAHAEQASKALSTPTTIPEVTSPVVQYSEDVWLGGKEAPLQSQLPTVFDRTVSFTSVQPQTLPIIAQRIHSATNVPVRIQGSQSSTNSSSAPAGSASLPPLFPAGTPSPSVSTANEPAFPYRHSGSLRSFLDFVAAQFGYAWRYRGGEVQFISHVTETFIIAAAPGDTQFSGTVGGQISQDSGSGGGSGSGADVNVNQVTSTTATLNVWSAIERNVKAMLSPTGTVSTTPTTGTLVVSDSPAVVARVGDYIHSQNQALTKQVLVQVRVVAVTERDVDALGMRLDVLLANAANATGYGLSVTTPDVVTIANAGQIGFGLFRPNGNTTASVDALIETLSEAANTSVLTTAQVFAMNNQPTPVNVVRRQGFLERVEAPATSITGVTSAPSLIPGEVVSGFVMTLLPRVLDGDKLLIQYHLNLSQLLGLETIGSGGQQIQIPQTDERSLKQTAFMGSGDVLVLSGFENIESSHSESGVGSKKNWLMGGKETSQDRTRLVVILSPTIVKDSTTFDVARDLSIGGYRL